MDKRTSTATRMVFSKIFFYIFFVSGFGLLGYQIYEWRDKGAWIGMPAGKIILPCLPDAALHWLREPKTWIGLQEAIVSVLKVPVSAVLILIGFIFLFFWD